ncbi:sensor histidine kinase [Ancylomarina sp. YFZ004]
MNLSERLYRLFSIRWVQHLSFWSAFIILISGRFFYMEATVIQNELLFEFCQMSIIAFWVYFNLRVLIPNLWNKGRYKQYVWAIILGQIIPISLLVLSFYYLPVHLLQLKINNQISKVLIMALFKTNFFVVTSSLFHFVKEWMKLKDENLRYTEKAQEQLEAELSLLKGQVNPHFLFNTLNNLYSMSLHDSKKTPEMILKLSQLLSYMLYECKDEMVNLEQEIAFVRNYIALEAIRVEDIAEVHFEVTGNNPGHKIPPLLFIPLIENAFKHGISSDVEHTDIRINLLIDDNKIELNTENPYDETRIDDENNHKGLGLENVSKRLELLYPNKYKLDINQNGHYFKTHLMLEISQS